MDKLKRLERQNIMLREQNSKLVCYRPRFGRISRLFWIELVSQRGRIIPPLIRNTFARPRSLHLAPAFP